MNEPTLPIKLRECATRVVNHCFNRPGDSALMSIPASRERDADLLFNEAADEIEQLQRDRDDALKALRDLYRAYVRLTESGRDRIIALGGDCDPVDVMERGDPYLQEAREVIKRLTAK